MADHGTVARPYAKAIFDTAIEANDLEGWSSALAAAAAVAGDAAAREFLTRPERSADDRAIFIGSLAAELEGAAVLSTAVGKNLLRLLSENDRLDALPEIARQFDELKADRENKVRVTLVSAVTVDPDQAQKVSGALSAKLGRAVELELEVEPSLIGGAIIRAEDRVIDDSLKTRLTRLTNALID